MSVNQITSMAALYTIMILAVISDCRTMKIRNRLIVMGLVLGLGFRILYEGPMGIVYFLVNIILPVILLYLLYLMGIIGAGDVKLFSVIGGFVNFKELMACILFSFVAGAVLSAMKMILKRNLITKLSSGVMYLMGILHGKIEPYKNRQFEKGDVIHFSVAILVGLILSHTIGLSV